MSEGLKCAICGKPIPVLLEWLYNGRFVHKECIPPSVCKTCGGTMTVKVRDRTYHHVLAPCSDCPPPSGGKSDE